MVVVVIGYGAADDDDSFHLAYPLEGFHCGTLDSPSWPLHPWPQGVTMNDATDDDYYHSNRDA